MTAEEIAQKSRKITEQLMALPEYVKAERLYAYVSYNQEVCTDILIKAALDSGKCVLVPRVYGDIIRYHEIKSPDELKPGAYGIPEPDNDRLDEVHHGLLLLPGLAFDKYKHRMGYGGGYYDKYLSMYGTHSTAALAYDFQVFDRIPVEEFDIPADFIITETRIIR